MNKKKILGSIIGIIGGYLISHYLISPLIFKNKQPNQTEITQALDAELNMLRQRIPMQIEQSSTLTAVDRRDLKIAYTYEIDQSVLPAFSNATKKAELCELMKASFKFGVEYDYIYKNESGTTLLTIPVNQTSCTI
ncbi:hypothetical protein BEN71_14085 [Acinetobacter wuhouensis]|uniref:hypothetical protein n=1 Tax=Acinetobacter wuhouensis TaxID=1879050 RepID=UPI00083B0292|nr:hypothetical protein [Acinetobacter wuhouensis]AXQ23136.1 hypothetical protein BEN71_14085 [Acinetobacter wuhouensis]